jgi:hypothetical protein
MPGCEAPKGWTKQETSASVRNSEIIAAISQISSTFVEEIQESKKRYTTKFLGVPYALPKYQENFWVGLR